MRKRDLVDGLVGPRTREMMDQMLCMNGMTNAEKVDFLMSRNRELRVELPQWPEVVTVLVGGKAMPFAPVTTDLAEEIRSKVEAWSEVAELEGTIECLKGLAEANYERCYTCEAMLDCDECLRADASHKELRGLQAENERLRELCRHLYACNQYCDREESDGGCSACSYQLLECDCGFEERLLELGIEVDV